MIRRFLVYGLVVPMAFFLVAPTIIVVIISFSSSSILFFPPPGYGLRWYDQFFHVSTWTDAAATSLKVATGSMLAATTLGTVTALGLVRGRYPARGLVNGLMLSPLIVPTVIVALGMYILYLRAHLVGTLLALMVAHSTLSLPYVVINVAAALRTMDPTVELAAQSLGAPPLRTFLMVTLPLILPSVVAGALFAFITSWDEVVVSLFLSTPFLQTLPVVIWTQVRSDVDPTVAAASSLVTGVSLLVLLGLFSARRRANVPG